MTLPYSNATGGDRALAECHKLLRTLGCAQVGVMHDYEHSAVVLQFVHQGRQAQLRASAKGYAAAWLRENPWRRQRRCSEAEHRQRALELGERAVYSILRDWLKGMVTAVQTGVLTPEAAFLSHYLLPDGKTVLEHVESTKLLPAPASDKP